MTSILDRKRAIARTVYEHQTRKGVRFRDGVVDEAASRAAATDNLKAEIEAIASAFEDYKIQEEAYG